MSYTARQSHPTSNGSMQNQLQSESNQRDNQSYRYDNRSLAGSTVVSKYTEKNFNTPWYKRMCGCQVNYEREKLEYDYNQDDTLSNNPQPLPRIREKGEYYIDSYNGEQWAFTFGTNEEVSEFFRYPSLFYDIRFDYSHSSPKYLMHRMAFG